MDDHGNATEDNRLVVVERKRWKNKDVGQLVMPTRDALDIFASH